MLGLHVDLDDGLKDGYEIGVMVGSKVGYEDCNTVG
jgi:hypothetical protein